MAVKKVLLLGNPKLRRKSVEVEEFDEKLDKIIADLKDTLTQLQNKQNIGRALAAPQIGYLKKVIYCNTKEEEIIMINPEIVDKSEEMFAVWDSCFSFKTSFFVNIPRHKRIKVKFMDEDGREINRVFENDFSELFQHEIDHLHGILATDHLVSNKNIIMREEWEKHTIKK
ncbi:MAG: peptide deformylase [Halanaerobiales bacterium]